MIYRKLLYKNKCLDCKNIFRAISPTKDLCQLCDMRLENFIARILREDLEK